MQDSPQDKPSNAFFYRSFVILAMLTILCLLVAHPAAAQQGLNGQPITVDFIYQATAGSQQTVTPGPGQTVTSSGVNYTFGFSNQNHVQVTPTLLIVTNTASTRYLSGNFNGYHMKEVGSSPAAITFVSMDLATDLFGFDNSRIVYDPENIFVDLQGLEFSSGKNVTLDITTESAVPEVSSVVSFSLLLALGGVVAVRRRTVSAQ